MDSQPHAEVDELVARLHALAAPRAAAADLDLVDVELKGTGPGRLVRLVVDRKGGVDLERCQHLSRQLEPMLDVVGEFSDGYALEVTSPGVDYPLRGQRAFDRVQGRTVLVHRDAGGSRVLQVDGTVTSAEHDAVVLDVRGVAARIPYAQIIKATQRLPW